jgi:hypothetical protein
MLMPERREAFTPVAWRLMGAGSETRAAELPTTLGVPMRMGDSLLVNAMVHNPTDERFEGVRIRVRLTYTATTSIGNGEGSRRGITNAAGFFLHVTPPQGPADFDLPPGPRTSPPRGITRSNPHSAPSQARSSGLTRIVDIKSPLAVRSAVEWGIHGNNSHEIPNPGAGGHRVGDSRGRRSPATREVPYRKRPHVPEHDLGTVGRLGERPGSGSGVRPHSDP